MNDNSKYGVFIIEFLRADDCADGEILSQILELSNIDVIYKWANNKIHLAELLQEFKKSKFRYLHISCHANETSLEINGDEITNSKFESISKDVLKNRRIFLSACKAANRDLAARLVSKNNAYSLLGVPINLRFDKSALFWPCFYHLINEIDASKMRREDIVETVKKCVNLFNIPVNYYAKSNYPNKLRRFKIRVGHTDNRLINI